MKTRAAVAYAAGKPLVIEEVDLEGPRAGEVMVELSALIAAGVLTPGRPTAYDLVDGPKALAELETRATVGKLALLL